MQDLMTLKKGDFYTWEDPDYHDFMNTLLKKLNPIEYQKHAIIANELDEFNELLLSTELITQSPNYSLFAHIDGSHHQAS